MGKIACLSFLLLSTFYYNVHCQKTSTNISASPDPTNWYKNLLNGINYTDPATLDQIETTLLADKDNKGTLGGGTGKKDSSISQSISDSGGSLNNDGSMKGSGSASSNEANLGTGGSSQEPIGDNSAGNSGSQLSESGTGGSGKVPIDGRDIAIDYVGGTGSSGGGFSGSNSGGNSGESTGANKGPNSGSETSKNSGFQTGGQSSVGGSSESGNGGNSGENKKENGDNTLSTSGNSGSGSGDSKMNGKGDTTGKLQKEVEKIKLSLGNRSGFVNRIFGFVINFVSNFQNAMSYGEYYVKTIQSFANGVLDTAGNTLSVPEKAILSVVGRILSTVLSTMGKITSYLPIVGNTLSSANNKVSGCVSRTTYELDKPVVESVKGCISSPVNRVSNTMTNLMDDFKKLSLFMQLMIGRFYLCDGMACRIKKVSNTLSSVAPVMLSTLYDIVTGFGKVGFTFVNIIPCFSANIPFTVVRNIASKSIEMFKCMF